MEHVTSQDRSISLLYVEDDEIIMRIQVSVLKAKYPDVVVHTACNGRSGLELFIKHTPDIVITDINMPEMCGIQMSENIRALKPDTKFIAITGLSEKVFRQNSNDKEFEFDHIIVKPVDLSVLFALVERCIGEIRLQVS